MPTGYEPAPDTVDAMINRLIDLNHPDLQKSKPTITALMAFEILPDSEDGESRKPGPCLRRFGFNVPARTRITSLEQRVGGMDDIVLQIDDHSWKELDQMKREAVLDQQLHSLEVMRDADGADKEDDAGRPKFRIKRPDWLVSGYETIARRYGHDSPEIRSWKKESARFNQLQFNWSEENEAVAAKAKGAKKTAKKPAVGTGSASVPVQ